MLLGSSLARPRSLSLFPLLVFEVFEVGCMMSSLPRLKCSLFSQKLMFSLIFSIYMPCLHAIYMLSKCYVSIYMLYLHSMFTCYPHNMLSTCYICMLCLYAMLHAIFTLFLHAIFILPSCYVKMLSTCYMYMLC